MTILRVKSGPCAPLRLSSMLSSPATGMTFISVTWGEPLSAWAASVLLDNILLRAFRSCLSGYQPLSRRFVEQMYELRIGHKPDLVAWLKLMAFAKHRSDFFVAYLGDDLDFRTGRLHDLYYCIRAILGKNEVFRSHA